jgi:hypothetical protein
VNVQPNQLPSNGPCRFSPILFCTRQCLDFKTPRVQSKINHDLNGFKGWMDKKIDF